MNLASIAVSFGTTRMTYGFEPFFTLLQIWSPWIWFAGVAAGYVTFLVVPALKRRRFYFVDGLCISQTDAELKLQGIRHLGGFVALTLGHFLVLLGFSAGYFGFGARDEARLAAVGVASETTPLKK